MKSKKIILYACVGFVILLLLLTFFSRTIYNFSIPSVTVAFPSNEVLSNTAKGNGAAEFTEYENLYAEVGGKITFHVEKGSVVSAGQDVYSIAGDDQSIRDALESAQEEIDRISQRIRKAEQDRWYTEDRQAIADYDYQIREAVTERQKIEAKAAEWREQLKSGGVTVVQAERDGVVLDIVPEDGSFVAKNSRLLRMGIYNGSYQVEIVFNGLESVDNIRTRSIEEGKTIPLDIYVAKRFSTEGTITKLSMQDGNVKAMVEFTAGNLEGGEIVRTEVVTLLEAFPRVLPNIAIHSDAAGNDYVYCVEKTRGRFGDEYTVRKYNVAVLARDEKNCFSTAPEDQPCVINSDMILYEGARVKIVGGGDLIEIR